MRILQERSSSAKTDIKCVTRLADLTPSQRAALPSAFCSFLDSAAVGVARASFYNTRHEQEQALDHVHRRLFAIDRGLYAACLLLPGVTDHTRRLGVIRLLSTARTRPALLSEPQEKTVLQCVCAALPPQRLFKLFEQLAACRVNNARTRKLILRTILTSNKVEFWAVKYRRKLAAALRHAWGKRTASIVRSILAKPQAVRSEKEQGILQTWIGRVLDGHGDRACVEECVGFILGIENNLTLPRLRAYHEAKRDLSEGASLPYEVLEGIRSRFHKEASNAAVFRMTRDQLTAGQQMAMQRKAAEAKVEVEFDPAKYDPVRLNIYAYEMGLTDEIRRELRRKARQAADRFPIRLQHAAVLLDVSGSMMGSNTQKRRPIAVALAMRDLLCAIADRATIITSDGRAVAPCELIEPAGDTSLAAGLVAALQAGPDVVFVISDGYENAPAGRFADVVHAARRAGIKTPICQVSPVFAAEALGTRQLCEQVPVMPVSQPGAIGLAVLKATIEQDVERGVDMLLGITLPALEGSGDGRRQIEVTHDVRQVISKHDNC